MKKRLSGAFVAFTIISAGTLCSCNTAKQADSDTETAETTTESTIESTPMEMDTVNGNNNTMETDSIRAVE